MKTKEMYLVNEVKYSSKRSHNIKAVTAIQGRKYLSLKGWDGRNVMKFDMEPEEDVNGNVWHRQVSEYSPDYVLYETYEGARDYLSREAFLHTIRNCNFDVLDVGTLSDIVSAINDFREKTKDKRRKEQ